MNPKRILTTGNEAIGYGAIAAGCRFYCGYPITPQNEIPAFFASELPKVGGIFVQTESEISSINMLLGVVSTGMRGITSTSSPGFSLMQEGISALHALALPAVVVNVQRGGPGSGSIASAQTDYMLATKSGGHGGVKSIVLAPASVQECHDLTQLAFHLSDQYRIVAVVLSDAIIGQSAEILEVQPLEFGELPNKNWALRGSAEKKGVRIVMDTYMPFNYGAFFPPLRKKLEQIEAKEVRFEGRFLEDAELVVVSWGSTARTSLDAVNQARAKGIKAGLFRPITLNPFPKAALQAAAKTARKVLVVEDNQGQMLYDVEWALGNSVPISFLGIEKRDLTSGMGLLYPQPMFDEIQRLAS